MRALISTCLTTRRTSGGTGSRRRSAACVISRDRNVVEYAADDDLWRDLLRLGLVRDDEPMAHDVEGDGLHVVRQHVVAPIEERVRAGRERHVDSGPWRRAVGD